VLFIGTQFSILYTFMYSPASNKSLLTKIPFQKIPKPSPIANYYSTPSRDEW
jgi:hypothetical protein